MPQHELMQFFAYEHLPAHLQAVIQPFGELARKFTGMTAAERKGDEWGPNGFTDVRDLRDAMAVALPSNVARSIMMAKFSRAEDAVVECYELAELLEILIEAQDWAVRALLYKAPGP